MGWITTKSGKRVNTDWFDDEDKKQKQIEANKKEADEKNGKEETYIERNEDGEIIFKAMITDDKGNRRAFQFSASSKEQARQDLKGNGYRVTPKTLLPKKLFDHVINHTNANDWDWDEAQKLFKTELKGK